VWGRGGGGREAGFRRHFRAFQCGDGARRGAGMEFGAGTGEGARMGLGGGTDGGGVTGRGAPSRPGPSAARLCPPGAAEG